MDSSGSVGIDARRVNTMTEPSVKRGDIFYADLSPVVGSEQGGTRPVLIVQNDTGNRHSPTVIAAAITSQTGKARLPTHINIAGGSVGLEQGFHHPSGADSHHRQAPPAGAHGASGRKPDGAGGRRHCRQLRPSRRRTGNMIHNEAPCGIECGRGRCIWKKITAYISETVRWERCR